MISAFAEGENIIPVKITVMEYNERVAPKIHVAMTTSEIKKTQIITNLTNVNSRELATTSFKIRLSQFLPLVKDAALAEHIPPQFRESNLQDFALRAPVEETKDLIAVHNATEKNVRGLLGLGGLPMPSIAIIKAAQGHDNFGEYSFVVILYAIFALRYSQKKNYGHVFIAEQVNGKTRFIDPQNGAKDVTHYFDSGKIRATETKLLRTDDKEISDLINKAVKNK